MRNCILLVASCILASLPSADQPKLIARPDYFKTLVNPNCSHCVDEAKRRASELKADERVLAWIRGKYDGGAIPLRFFLVPYRVISDTYGVFVYDFEAGYVRGYEPSLDFTFYGWRNGVMVIKHKDGTLFSALTGKAFDGPRKGEALKPVATIESNWGPWLKAYPGTVAYHMYPEKYKPFDIPGVLAEDSVATRPALDERLKTDDMVIGVEIDGVARAYPLSLVAQKSAGSFGKSINDKIGDQDVVVLWYEPTKTAAVYARSMDNEKIPDRLTLNPNAQIPTAPFMDKETYSHWDIAGRAVEGPLKGKTLRWLPGVQCKWFAWAAEYPQTDIYAPPAKAVEEPRPPLIAKLIQGERIDWPKMIRSYARIVSVTPTTVVVATEKDKSAGSVGKEHALTLTPQTEIFSHGAFGTISEFVPGQRVWVLATTNEKKEGVALHAIADEISMQLMSAGSPGSPPWVLKESLEGGRRLVFTDEKERKGTQTILLDANSRVTLRTSPTPGKTAYYWNSREENGSRIALELFDDQTIEARRKAQQSRSVAEAARGLVATVVEIDEQNHRVALLVRRAEAWYARHLMTYDAVRIDIGRLEDGKDGSPRLVFQSSNLPTFQVVEVRPDYSRTRVRLQVPVSCPMSFQLGQEVRVQMTLPKLIDPTAIPDLGRFKDRQDRIDFFLSTMYCTCGMMGDS